MSKIIERKMKINEEISASYVLAYENGEYGIECTEYDSDGNITESSKVGEITAELGWATEIFNLVYENGVLPCTLTDVICDLIC